MKQATGGEDRSFEQLVARELSHQRRPAEDCPQTELLAAWFDRSLADSQAAPVERHLADCDRCQALVAALARSEPEVVYARPRLEPRPWAWHLRWLAPAAAALVVAAVGLTVAVRNLPTSKPEEAARQVAAASPSPALPATATPSTTSAVPEPAVASPASPALPAPSAKLDRDELRRGTAASGTVASGAGAVRPRPLTTPSPAEQQLALREQAPGADKPTTFTRAKEAAPAPPPTETGRQAAAVGGAERQDLAGQPRAAKAEAEANQAPPAEGRVAERFARAAPAPAPTAVLMRDAAAARPRQGDVAAQPLTAFAPGERVGWRYGRPGVILRTDDGGAAWSEQRLPAPTALVAVSAVSSSVCWAIGDAVVMRTADGRTWLTVTPPVGGGLASITATSERAARVRTADGIVYETSDAGGAWRRR